MKSFVTITDWNQTCTACKFQALGFYKKLPDQKQPHQPKGHKTDPTYVAQQKIFKKNLTPYTEYNEYSEEHAVPKKDSRYALFDRFAGVSGNIERTATTKTCRKIPESNFRATSLK